MRLDHKNQEEGMKSAWKYGLLVLVSLGAWLTFLSVCVTFLFPRAIFEFVLPDQTVYASGYSEDRFSTIHPGMDTQQVVSILGTPVEVVVEPSDRQTYTCSWENRPKDFTGVRRWWLNYSKHGRYTDSFSVRSIELSPSGIVIALEHHYYQD